jgi:hypothetical protein
MGGQMAAKQNITTKKTAKADLNTESNWIFALSILDNTADWEILHWYGHLRIKQAFLFIHFHEESTFEQFDRWQMFRDRLAEQLEKIAQDNPDFNPVHFFKQKLARGRISPMGLPLRIGLMIWRTGQSSYASASKVMTF